MVTSGYMESYIGKGSYALMSNGKIVDPAHRAGSAVVSNEARKVSSVDDVLDLVDLNWGLTAQPVRYGYWDRDNTEQYVRIPGKKLISRDDLPVSDPNRCLSVVSEGYEPIGNRELLTAAIQPLLDRDHTGLLLDAGGTRKGGKEIWIQFKGGEFRFGKDGVLSPTVLITGTHDGTGACKIMPRIHDIWCTNQIAGILSGKGGISIRHSKEAHQKLLTAGDILAQADTVWKAETAYAQRLSETKVSDRFVRAMLLGIYPDQVEGKEQPRAEKHRESILDLYHWGQAGAHLAVKAPGNAYALSSAVTQHIQHDRQYKSVETYLESVSKGSAFLETHQFAKAFDKCLEYAEAGEVEQTIQSFDLA